MQENLIPFSLIAGLAEDSALRRCRDVPWRGGKTTDSTQAFHFSARGVTRVFLAVSCLTSAGCNGTIARESAGASSAQVQTATVNWTDVHQIIDGFGASDAYQGGSTTPANQALFFGTGPGQLGYSILRVSVPSGNGSYTPGVCTSVGTSCAGLYLADMQAAVSYGAKVYASSWTPPAIYTTNGSTNCSGDSGLAEASYGNYATWLANFVQSLAAQGVTLYALSVQNEPNLCGSANSAYWTAGNLDTFIANNLGPTFASDGLSTLIFMPETNVYSQISNYGGTCVTDTSCVNYVGGYNWHDYDASLSGTNTVAADPYPSSWASGKKYWETEASCGPGFGPSFCESGYNTDITDGLNWGAVIDQRIAGDNANAWLYWWLYSTNPTDDEGLSDGKGNVAARGYVLAQYSKFVRPGYYRIDATRQPQSGVSVSAYQNTATNTLVIIATNYNGSAVSQTFTLANAPTFSKLTPTITSATQSLATQSTVSVSGNSFTSTLPADSITTFVGSASIPSQ
jgi:glucuronoarabinoxylan endo-1,4-beta-xylanase